jgi:hypothetical protein
MPIEFRVKYDPQYIHWFLGFNLLTHKGDG